MKRMIPAILVTAAWTNFAMASETAPEAKNSSAQGKEARTLKVSFTPEEPYLLLDGRTKIVVKEESIYFGRGERSGTVQVHLDDSVLTIVPRTVIHAGGYRLDFNTAPSFVFSHVRDEDMIFTVVDRCNLTVRCVRQDTPRVALKELGETIEMTCTHGRVYKDLYTIRGNGQHFVSLKPTSISISRFHPDPELGARVEMDVINNSGAKSITLDYKKKKEVALGQETITIESSGFDYETKTMKVRISTVPKTADAASTVVEYGTP